MRRAPLLTIILPIIAAVAGCRGDGGSPQAERPNAQNTDPAHHAALGDAAILTLEGAEG